jgi:hypothetical protein
MHTETLNFFNHCADAYFDLAAPIGAYERMDQSETASCLCVRHVFWSLAMEAPSYSSSSTKPSVHQRGTRQLSRCDPFLLEHF